MLLPYLLAGLGPGVVADYRAATYMVLGRLAAHATFSADLVESECPPVFLAGRCCLRFPMPAACFLACLELHVAAASSLGYQWEDILVCLKLFPWGRVLRCWPVMQASRSRRPERTSLSVCIP
jgi:hypothetical protein